MNCLCRFANSPIFVPLNDKVLQRLQLHIGEMYILNCKVRTFEFNTIPERKQEARADQQPRGKRETVQ